MNCNRETKFTWLTSSSFVFTCYNLIQEILDMGRERGRLTIQRITTIPTYTPYVRLLGEKLEWLGTTQGFRSLAASSYSQYIKFFLRPANVVSIPSSEYEDNPCV